jgi:hypothetical protein
MVAAWTWDPTCLIGLLPYLVLRVLIKPGQCAEYEKGIVDRPWASAREWTANVPLLYHIAPLGLFWLGATSWPVVACLCLAYAQCLVASDRLRLYGWAIPVLIPGTLTALAALEPGVAVLIAVAATVAAHAVAETRRY